MISLRFELTENNKKTFDVEQAVKSSNVIVSRKNKEKKSQLFKFNQLLAIDQTSLNITKIQIDLKNQSSSESIELVNLKEANILSNDQKRTKKLINKYAQIVWENENMKKFSSFHAKFLINLIKSIYVN